ncbi:MAG TPA: STAS domain-containing protein, partial [Solirubrobacterales bacterium]|nr:STAS domain-containing protein [Solirubrobacterales bacterium]
LVASLASAADSVLLDLEELTFIDAAGLYSLCAASSRSIEKGSRLRMTRGKGHVAAIFHLTALDAILPFGNA